MDDFLNKYSSDYMQKLFEQESQKNNAAVAELDNTQPAIQDLSNQAVSATKAFQSTAKTLGDNNQDIYSKLARAKALPSGISNFLGMFDSDFSVKSLTARAQGNSSALDNARRSYDANMTVIGQQTSALKDQVENKVKSAQLTNAATDNIIQGLNASISLDKREKDLQKNYLMTIGDKKLQSALVSAKDSPEVKVDGKVYPREVVFGAMTSRQKLDQEIVGGQLDIQGKVLGNAKSAMDLHNQRIENVAKELNPTDMLALSRQVRPDGTVVLQSSDGSKMGVDWDQLAGVFWKQNADAAPAREQQARYAEGANRINTIAQTQLSQADALLAMTNTGMDSETKKIYSSSAFGPELLLTSGTIAKHSKDLTEISRKAAAQEPLSPEDVFGTLSQNNLQVMDSALVAQKVAGEKALAGLTTGASPARKSAIEEMMNNKLRIVGGKTATDATVESALTPSEFTGPDAPISVVMANYMTSEQDKNTFAFDKDGKPKDPETFFNNIMNKADGKNSEQTRYLSVDKAAKGGGFKAGLPAAVASAHMDWLVKEAASRYVKDSAATGGTSPIGNLLTGDGEWTPEFKAIRDQVGTAQAMMLMLAKADAPDIQAGKKSLNDNTASKFGAYVTSQLQSGALKLPAPTTPASAALRKIAYDNKDETRLGSILSGVFNQAPTTITNQLKSMKAQVDDRLNNAGRVNDMELTTDMPQLDRAIEDYYTSKTLNSTLGKLP